MNIKQFKKINTPEISYILGLLWSDGSFYKNSISLWMKREDLETLHNIFEKTGYWNIYYRKLKNRKEQMCFNLNNKELFDFLKEFEFEEKSIKSPYKILKLIPESLKHYFFRGIFDGDGTIYSTNRQNILNITSTYEQDWSDLIDIFEKLNIKYSISKTIHINKKNKRNSMSRIVTQNMDGVVKFCNYIYDGYFDDKIGLNRKFQIYLEINDKLNIIKEKEKIKSEIYCTHCNTSNFSFRGKYRYGIRCYCKNCKKSFTHKNCIVKN